MRPELFDDHGNGLSRNAVIAQAGFNPHPFKKRSGHLDGLVHARIIITLASSPDTLGVLQ